MNDSARIFDEYGGDVRLLRIFLVFFFTSLGAGVGVWLGGYRLFANLFS